jgi:hypothetical protein
VSRVFGSGQSRRSDVRGGLENFLVFGSDKIPLGFARDTDEDSSFPLDNSSSLDVTSSLSSNSGCFGCSVTLSGSSSGSSGRSGRTGL